MSLVEAFSSVPGLIKNGMLGEFISKLKNRKAVGPSSLVSISTNKFDNPSFQIRLALATCRQIFCNLVFF